MIVGNGTIAKAFEFYKNNDGVLIFASGVSNSQEIDSDAFKRERDLLIDNIKNNQNKLFVYFGTCSVYDDSVNKTEYVAHKLKMESLVRTMCSQYYIFRLPQVVGPSNNKTLVNYLFASILNNTEIDIYQNSTRNLIDSSDVFSVANYVISNGLYINEITNIATPNNASILQILKTIEDITGLLFQANLIDSGKKNNIDITKIYDLDREFNFFSDDYMRNILSAFFLYKKSEKETTGEYRQKDN